MDGIDRINPTPTDLVKLETFICRLYKDRTASSLNAVRVRTFLTGSKPEDMPPTSDSARFHILRALCQAFIWDNAHIPMLEEQVQVLKMKCFKIEGAGLVPILMEQVPVPKHIVDLIACACKTGCKNRRCVCLKANLKCSILCHGRTNTDSATPCTNVTQ